MVMHSVMKLLLVSTQPGPGGIRWLDYPCKNTAPQGKKGDAETQLVSRPIIDATS